MRPTTRLRELLAEQDAPARARLLQRAVREDPRARRLPRRLHDRLRHLAVPTGHARRRAGDDDRDAPQRALHRQRGSAARHRRRRQRLRQRDQRDPDRARVHPDRRGGDPHRGPGDPEALRPRRRPPGDPDRRGGGQVPRRRRGPARARPGLRAHRPHRRPGRPRRQPRRGDRARQRVPRRRRRHGLRGGPDQRRRGAPHLPRGQGPGVLQPDRGLSALLDGRAPRPRHRRSPSCPARCCG